MLLMKKFFAENLILDFFDLASLSFVEKKCFMQQSIVIIETNQQKPTNIFSDIENLWVQKFYIQRKQSTIVYVCE